MESFSHYNFTQFSIDPDWVEAIGSVPGVVNCELEVWLGTHANGPLEFVERGSPSQVKGLVEILDHYLKQFPANILLATWMDDALAGAIHTYLKANLPVSMQFTKYLWIIIAKTNVFDPVMQQLPYINTAEMTARENSWLSATKLNKKRPLQFSDATEHTAAVKWPKASGKKVQTKLTNIIKTDTRACTSYSIIWQVKVLTLTCCRLIMTQMTS